jgi:hypothetical protein
MDRQACFYTKIWSLHPQHLKSKGAQQDSMPWSRLILHARQQLWTVV